MKEFMKVITVRRFVFFSVVVFSFFYFQDVIQNVIENYLLTSNDFSSIYLNSFIAFFTITSIIYICVKIFRDDYILSFSQVSFCLSIFLMLLYFRSNETDYNWRFIEINSVALNFKYIDILIFLSISVPFARILKTSVEKDSYPQKSTNSYWSDHPLENIEDDELKYESVIQKLSTILKTENHNNSFSIGLVGPWGNGKSSIIDNVIKNITDSRLKNTIIIEFSPYLNHNEDEIINSFFEALSEKLSKYSGQLSNQILEYSNKINNLIRDQNLFNFIEKPLLTDKNKPVKELYDSIDNTLKKINKRIIVFVDDLDRLNEKEILQTLKLIRNTANFRKTIFVVAMDKEYVLRRLKSNNDILSTRFIDKFFQLEIFLPEIDKQTLKNIFSKMLKASKLDVEIYQLDRTINHRDILFFDYVKNVRDVKRIVNQIIFEYPFIKNEIDFKDFMNFIFFKLKFPKAIKIINDNRKELLSVNSEMYSLKKEGGESNKTQVSLQIGDLSKYEIYQKKLSENNKINKKYEINEGEEMLFIKSLAYMFGDENKVESHNSIKFENNFRKLIQQRLSSTDLSENEFKNLLSGNNNELITKLQNLSNQNKLYQLYNRLNYFNSKDDSDLKRVILSLILIYDSHSNHVTESELLKLIAVFVKRHIDTDLPDISTWFKNEIFTTKITSNRIKLLLLGHLWNSREENKLWGVDKKFIKNSSIKIFDNYMDSFQDKVWDYKDYDFYRVYHTIKNIEGIKTIINKKIIEFWSKNKIDVLCVQLTRPESFSYNVFKISEVERDIFGSKSKYVDFIRKHHQSSTKDIQEYLEFLKLLEITNHQISIQFEFVEFEMMVKKVKKLSEENNADDYCQVFFETNYSHLLKTMDKISSEFKSYSHQNFRYYQYENLYYFFVTVNKSEYKNSIIEYSKMLYSAANERSKGEVEFNESKVLKQENFLDNSGENFIKLYSIQPKSLNI